MKDLLKNLKFKLLCSLVLVFGVCLVFGTVFYVPATASENYIDSYSLTLSDDLSVNFFANESIGEDAYIVASVEGVDGKKTVYANVDNAYKFTVTDLAPQLMSRKISVTLFNANGEEKGSETITLSDYCKTLLDRGASGNNMGEKEFKSLSTLVVDLLNYGASAQDFVGDTTYAKCNAFLSTESYKSFAGGTYDMPGASSFNASVKDEATAANIKPTTAKLYLDYNVVAKISFEVKDLVIDGVKAVVGDSEVTATVSSVATQTEGVTAYTVSVPLSVLDIEKEISVTLLSQNKEVGYTVKGSVSGYLATRNANDETSDKIIAAKLYSYAKSAAATLVTPTYTVTLELGATGGELAFSDGKKNAEVTVGEALPALTEVENFLGFMNEDGTIYSVDTFKMPSKDITLVPVINTDAYVTTGDGKLDYGKQKEAASNIDYYTSQNFGGFAYIPKQGNPVVIETEDGKKELGQLYTNVIANGTTTDAKGDIRLYAPYPRTTTGLKLKFTIAHKNYGDEALDFDLYMRGSGSDTSTIESKNIKLDAKGDVQVVTIEWVVNITHTYEVFFHYKFNTAVKSGAFGAYAYVEVVQETYSATLKTGTFDDGTTTKSFMAGAVVTGIKLNGSDPYALTLTDADGKSTSGIYGKVLMPGYDVTITPAAFSPVKSGSGDIDWSNGSIQTNWDTKASPSFGSKYAVCDSVVGTTYVVSGVVNSQFRIMTAYSVNSSRTYVMKYTFKNVGDSSISFKYNQVNSGNDRSGNIGSQMTLTAGEEKTVELTFKGWSNSNVMCYFEILDESGWSNAKLFVASSITES